MKRLLVEDFGKASKEFNDVVAFDVLTRDDITHRLEEADIFPSSKNIDAFIKALPVTMYNGVPEEKHLQMAMQKCKDEDRFTKASVIEKMRIPGEGITTFSLEDLLCDHEKIVYFACEDDQYPHQLIYHETFGDLIELMSTKEGLTKIFEYTLVRLLDAGERDTIIQFITGLRVNKSEDVYLYCLYGYSLPARILWYDFNPRSLPVYAVKVQKGTFDAPLKLNLFDPQKDFTNTCLDGIVICGNEHYPVLGNTEDMKTWVKTFPELQESYKTDTLSKEIPKLRKLFPKMICGNEFYIAPFLRTLCENWRNEYANDPLDAWNNNKPIVIQAVLEFMYGEVYRYRTITNIYGHVDSKQVVYFQKNKFSDYAIKKLRAQYYDEGDTYIILYKEPTKEILENIETWIYDPDFLYDTAYASANTAEKVKNEISRMMNHREVTVLQ